MKDNLLISYLQYIAAERYRYKPDKGHTKIQLGYLSLFVFLLLFLPLLLIFCYRTITDPIFPQVCHDIWESLKYKVSFFFRDKKRSSHHHHHHHHHNEYALYGKPLKEERHYIVQNDKGSQMANGEEYEQKAPASRQRDQMDDDNNEPPPPYKSKSPYHGRPDSIIFDEEGASSQQENERRLRSPVKHEEHKEGVFREDPKGSRNVGASPYKPKDTENLFYGYQEPPPKRSIKPVEENHIINAPADQNQRRAIRGVQTTANVDHLGNDW